MKTIKRFDNPLGYTEIRKYENGTYACSMHSDFAQVSHLTQYEFKRDAIVMYQFYCYWLETNVNSCL